MVIEWLLFPNERDRSVFETRSIFCDIKLKERRPIWEVRLM